MLEKSRVYSQEVKEEVVCAYLNSNLSANEIAKRYGISSPTVIRWAENYNGNSEKDQQKKIVSSSRTEYEFLLAENERLKTIIKMLVEQL